MTVELEQPLESATINETSYVPRAAAYRVGAGLSGMPSRVVELAGAAARLQNCETMLAPASVEDPALLNVMRPGAVVPAEASAPSGPDAVMSAVGGFGQATGGDIAWFVAVIGIFRVGVAEASETMTTSLVIDSEAVGAYSTVIVAQEAGGRSKRLAVERSFPEQSVVSGPGSERSSDIASVMLEM